MATATVMATSNGNNDGVGNSGSNGDSNGVGNSDGNDKVNVDGDSNGNGNGNSDKSSGRFVTDASNGGKFSSNFADATASHPACVMR